MHFFNPSPPPSPSRGEGVSAVLNTLKLHNPCKLNEARKQIDYSAVKVRINLDLATNIEGYPIAIFKTYFPRVINPIAEDDYIISQPIVYKGQEKITPAEYGYKKIIQMSYYVARNRLFKEVVRDSSSIRDL